VDAGKSSCMQIVWPLPLTVCSAPGQILSLFRWIIPYLSLVYTV